MYLYDKTETTKGSVTEVYCELSFNNLPWCEIKMMGLMGGVKTLV